LHPHLVIPGPHENPALACFSLLAIVDASDLARSGPSIPVAAVWSKAYEHWVNPSARRHEFDILSGGFWS
jgi:hypothetical protein